MFAELGRREGNCGAGRISKWASRSQSLRLHHHAPVRNYYPGTIFRFNTVLDLLLAGHCNSNPGQETCINLHQHLDIVTGPF